MKRALQKSIHVIIGAALLSIVAAFAAVPAASAAAAVDQRTTHLQAVEQTQPAYPCGIPGRC